MPRLYVLLATFAISVLFAVQSFAGNDLYYSAFDLAIEHFNADGSKEIKAWGPEHALMYRALEAVAKKLPEVQAASKMSAHGAEKRFSSLALTFRGSAMKTAEASASMANIMANIMAIVAGCGYRRGTIVSEEDLGYSDPSETKSVITTYYLSGTGKKKCTSAAAKTLASLSLNEVVISQNETRGEGAVEVLLRNPGSDIQDMRYVKSVLLKSPDIDSDLISHFDPPTTGGVIGASSDIALVGSNGKASLTDKFQLKYYIGSGDCPAGCISRTYYTVEIEPTAPAGATGPSLKITVL